MLLDNEVLRGGFRKEEQKAGKQFTWNKNYERII
jgi:hypothetical protein